MSEPNPATTIATVSILGDNNITIINSDGNCIGSVTLSPQFVKDVATAVVDKLQQLLTSQLKACVTRLSKRGWSVRFRIFADNQEVNKCLSGFATRKLANEAYLKFMSAYIPSAKVDAESRSLTLDQLFHNYLLYAIDRLKVSTIFTIKQEYKNHIRPSFGNIKIIDISKKAIYAWQQNLSSNSKNFASAYKSKIKGFLSAILAFAVRYFDLPFNPVSFV